MRVRPRFSDELLQEQAYLISRGVRPLTLIGTVPCDYWTMLKMLNRLEAVESSRLAAGRETPGDNRVEGRGSRWSPIKEPSNEY